MDIKGENIGKQEETKMNRRDSMVELCICFGGLSKQYRFGEKEKAQLKTVIRDWAKELQETGEEPEAFALRKFTEAGWIPGNTEVGYLYRDADNYKIWNTCVVKGTLTEAEQAEIRSCCDGGEYFYPHLVGLPEEKYEGTDADVLWLELVGFEQTDRKPDVDLTAKELLERFREKKDRWGILEEPGF